MSKSSEYEKYAECTREEKLAIAALKRLASRWPDSLWLFSASGRLCVMKCDENCERVYHPDSRGGGTDQAWIVDRIDIPNDGGDW